MSPLLASLLHSLWIGALVWGLAWAVLRALPAGAVEKRHGVALAAALALFLGWAWSWSVLRARLDPPARGAAWEAAEDREAAEEVSLAGAGAMAGATTTQATPTGAGPNDAAAERAGAAGGAWLGARVAAVRRGATWQGLLEWVWAAGVAVGLARLFAGLLAGGGGGRDGGGRSSRALPEAWVAAWRGLLEAEARRLGATLVAWERAGAPFVAGWVAPLIVVPLASCAGVSVEMARVALAHELAHVARRDWITEVGLRVLEAALFFNPFAWFLSAQVRLEREACCDMWACAKLGMPRWKFAESLTAWARSLAGGDGRAEGRAPAPSSLSGVGAGLGLGVGRGALRGRVDRLLGLRSRRRVLGWRGAVGVVVVVAAVLAGGGLALRRGAVALREAERVALLEQTSAPYRRPDPWVPDAPSEASPERVVSGRLVDEAGRAVAGARVHVLPADARQEYWVVSDAEGKFDGTRAVRGSATVWAWAEGFAPAKTALQANEREPTGPIVMGVGVMVPVRILDEAGAPLVGATVDWELRGGMPRDKQRSFTDATGVARGSHLSPSMPVTLHAQAAGHAAGRRRDLRVDEWLATGEVPEIRLRRGRVVRVRLVAEGDGSPVAGAGLRIATAAAEAGPGAVVYPDWNYRGLRTNADGEARLDFLRADADYGIEVAMPGRSADRFGFALGRGGAGESEQVVTVPRRWRVAVEFVNLPEPHRGGSLHLVEARESRPDWNAPAFHGRVPMKVDREGTGRVVVEGRGETSVTLSFREPELRPLELKVTRAMIAAGAARVDHDREAAVRGAGPMRRVEIRFMNDGQRMYPAGRFYIHRQVAEYVWDADGFALEPGKPLFAEWSVGTRLRLTAGWGLVGAMIEPEVVDKDAELVIEATSEELVVPVRPAGMVRVQVLDAVGRVVEDASVNGSSDHEEPSERRRILFNSPARGADWAVSEPVAYSFFGTPIWAAKGLVFVRGSKVNVSARRPVADVTLTLPKTRTYRLRFTDEAGAALAGVECSLMLRFGARHGDGASTGRVEGTSDGSGRVRFVAGEDLTRWKDVELMVEATAPGFERTALAVPVGELTEERAVGMERAAE